MEDMRILQNFFKYELKIKYKMPVIRVDSIIRKSIYNFLYFGL